MKRRAKRVVHTLRQTINQIAANFDQQRNGQFLKRQTVRPALLEDAVRCRSVADKGLKLRPLSLKLPQNPVVFGIWYTPSGQMSPGA